MNIFRWVRRNIFQVGEKSYKEILFEISVLTEGLSRAVKQIAEIHEDLPTIRFIEDSLGKGLLGKVDTINSSLDTVCGEIRILGSRLMALEDKLDQHIKEWDVGNENTEEDQAEETEGDSGEDPPPGAG